MSSQSHPSLLSYKPETASSPIISDTTSLHSLLLAHQPARRKAGTWMWGFLFQVFPNEDPSREAHNREDEALDP